MLKNWFKYIICTNNYKKVIRRIKENNINKIRILFYVSENSKWGYQSLYDLMVNDEKFEVIICVGVLSRVHKGRDKTRNIADENYDFFKTRGMNVKYVYQNHKYINFKKFKPDIVFYEQPWEMPKVYSPLYVSKFALTCYCSYSFEITNDKDNYKQNFHKLLWKYFVENDINTIRYESYAKENSKNCFTVGYPKLDAYLNKSKIISSIWKDQDKFKIIYAPHHSFESGSLEFATFKENGKFILEYAKKHTETSWIFKPHPRLKYALLRNKIMNEEEINSYYNEWAKIGRIYEQGDYFDIFKSSDLMITDCISFLTEYLPSKNPLIMLVNRNSCKLNSLGEKITSEYYKVNNNSELEQVLNEIISKQNDYKAKKRMDLISEVLDYKESSAEKIVKYLKRELT